MDETKLLADYVTKARYDELPTEVILHTKRCVMDTISCGLGGRKTSDADIFLKTMKDIGGPSESTVFGDSTKLSFTQAAQANRLLANILDYDDALLKVGHMSIVLIPVALALGEKLHSSGKEIINALVQGYETIIRIRNAVDPSRHAYVNTFEKVDSGTQFGVTIVAGLLLGLNSNQMADAIGLTGFARASRVTYPERAVKGMPSWMKITSGDSLVPGISSAFLAKNGCYGDRHILERGETYGLIVGSDRYDSSQLTCKLGEEYGMLRIGFKFYPACRYTSTTIDATVAIINENEINADDIERIVVRGNKNLANNFQNYDPDHMIAAQFSIPYVVAVALSGKDRTEWYTEETLKSPWISEQQHKVTIEEDRIATDKFLTSYIACATVEIKMKNGKSYGKHVDYPKGDPENPFSNEDHMNKLTWLASHCGMRQEQIDELSLTLQRIEKLNDISQLTRLIML